MSDPAKYNNDEIEDIPNSSSLMDQAFEKAMKTTIEARDSCRAAIKVEEKAMNTAVEQLSAMSGDIEKAGMSNEMNMMIEGATRSNRARIENLKLCAEAFDASHDAWKVLLR